MLCDESTLVRERRDQRLSLDLKQVVPAVGELGGAWPFLVGGLACQVDSGNERDLSLLNSSFRFAGRQTS